MITENLFRPQLEKPTGYRVPYYPGIEYFLPNWLDKYSDAHLTLTQSESEVVSPMVNQGDSISEVSAKLGIDVETGRQRLHRARTKIEPIMFEPVGIFRVASLRNIHLQEAIYYGYMKGFKFLNLFYTNNQALEEYLDPQSVLNRRRRIRQQ